MKRSLKYSRRNSSEQGMALITVLLFLILMSALAFALLYKVNVEQKVQKTDSGNTVAFYAAEAAMEKMNADLNALYATQAAPDWCDIQGVVASTNQPAQSFVDVTYPEYGITVPSTPSGCTPPAMHAQLITQGPSAGLQALIVPLTLQVTAHRASGEEVRMLRNIEVAEIPVFQFGMFSETDLAFFPGSNTDLAGRVQTNHNLFLMPSSGNNVTLHSSVRAAGDVIRDEMPNGRNAISDGRTGNVKLPTSPAGCDGTGPACRPLKQSGPNEGSATGGPTPANCDPAIAHEPGGSALCNGTPISGWQTVSTSTYNGMILSASTGAKPLTLSFVQPGVGPIEIIRRPQPGESTTSALGASRLYNLAQIRVLLSDDPSELPASAGYQAFGSTYCASPCLDPQNIRLANVQTNGNAPDYSAGVSIGGSATNKLMFAEGTTNTGASGVVYELDWQTPLAIPSYATTMTPTTAPIISSGSPTTWNLLDGYLRVEIRQTDGTYLPVTQEWLQYGFARGYEVPSRTNSNTVNPNAILLLQELADRDSPSYNALSPGPGSPSAYSGTPNYAKYPNGGASPARQPRVSPAVTYVAPELATDGTTSSQIYGAGTRNNWYPINFYDSREGEWRSTQRTSGTAPTCYVNGVMNAVEIDVSNLRNWLLGAGAYSGGSGNLAETDSQNGYVLYYSDRRGMLANGTTTASASGSSNGAKTGEYGFEDTINTNASSSTPNGTLDAGEDVDGNGSLDTWGKLDIGYGFGSAARQTPGAQIGCLTTARKNWVSGARHVVRLVRGWRGQIPEKSDGTGGFTLASENPAYVVGDFNALASEGGAADAETGTFTQSHASSAVIADAVTLLSNSYTDLETWRFPAQAPSRTGSTTYYRMAIASGKNMNYPYNATWAAGDDDFGLDGGAHNFLRYLENMNGTTVSYLGSMVSLYYSMYATGVFKCCDYAVYQWPTRDYAFDSDFLDLTKMPPGTPRFRDVVNLGFQQVF